MVRFNGINRNKTLTTLHLEKLIVSGHDISDGGLVTCLLEMAFAGVCGFDVDIPTVPGIRQGDPLQILFAEELGMVLEVEPEHESRVLERFNTLKVPCFKIGCTKQSGAEAQVNINFKLFIKFFWIYPFFEFLTCRFVYA